MRLSIDITGLDKAKVLKTLWDHSHSQGRSFISKQRVDDSGFTIEKAQKEIDCYKGHRLHFYYVYGHIIKCDITDDEFDPWLYDEACGEGMAQKAIDDLRKEEEMMSKCANYDGSLITVKFGRFANNDTIAEMFHNAFKGKQDYIDNNVIISKDPELSLYVCVNDLINRDDIIETLVGTLKHVNASKG